MSTIPDTEEDRPSSVAGSSEKPEAGFTLNAEVAEFAPTFVPNFAAPSFQGLYTSAHAYTHALEMAKDQFGCRLLQQVLEDNAAVQPIFSQVIAGFPDLMVDAFGNYLCQKLVELLSEEQLQAVLDVVLPSVFHVSVNIHGTRAVQKLVEVCAVHPAMTSQLQTHLAPCITSLVRDPNGNHVVSYLLI